jgi:aryl-alcohol dehydrogenase-like predicted oxidoreductase
MQLRKLGELGPLVSSIGLGCMGMSEFYGAADDEASIKLIHEAVARGVSFFDSADMYGPFTNEELLGKALKGRRQQVTIATKFGFVRDDKGGYHGVSGRPDYIRAACEASLRRLQVEYIDLYYQHRVDPTVPIEESVGAMADLVRTGKVRFIGLSEAAPATVRRAYREHPITALQTEYSLWSRDPEREHFALCRELGIAFVAYSPLGRGFLTGKIRDFDDLAADDFRRNSPRFMGENFQRNLAVVDEVGKLAERHGCTAAQVALAWLLAQGENLIPIPGTTKLARLEENIAATEVRLSAADLAALDAVAPKDFAAGERYPEERMKMLNL